MTRPRGRTGCERRRLFEPAEFRQKQALDAAIGRDHTGLDGVAAAAKCGCGRGAEAACGTEWRLRDLHTYALAWEPSGEDYRSLIRALAHLAVSVVLVLRAGDSLDPRGAIFVEKLRRHGATVRQGARWPGTQLLFGREATIIETPVTNDVIELLAEGADRLFEWEQPTLPEDLSFVRDDGSTVLATISHEADAFVVLDESELSALTRVVPIARRLLVEEV